MLQAQRFDAQTDPTATEENPYPYGWRYVTKRLPTGEEVYDQIPLTAYDLLNPQLDDQVPQRDEHFQLVVDLVASLKTYSDLINSKYPLERNKDYCAFELNQLEIPSGAQ